MHTSHIYTHTPIHKYTHIHMQTDIHESNKSLASRNTDISVIAQSSATVELNTVRECKSVTESVGIVKQNIWCHLDYQQGDTEYH